jgi:hypothetical protein
MTKISYGEGLFGEAYIHEGILACNSNQFAQRLQAAQPHRRRRVELAAHKAVVADLVFPVITSDENFDNADLTDSVRLLLWSI